MMCSFSTDRIRNIEQEIFGKRKVTKIAQPMYEISLKSITLYVLNSRRDKEYNIALKVKVYKFQEYSISNQLHLH